MSESDEEDPISESRRFSALVSLLVTNVPELGDWWRDEWWQDSPCDYEFDPEVLTLFEAYYLVRTRLFDDHDRPLDTDRVWPRLLPVVEVALELCQLLFDSDRQDDSTSMDAFAGAGIVCDITRTVASLEKLLPFMGPVTLDSVLFEIDNHSTIRGYEADAVDWSRSGIAYRPLGISPLSLVPAQRV